MGTVIGYFTILFEITCIIVLLASIAYILYSGNPEIIEFQFKRKSKWTIIKHFNFEGPYYNNEIKIPVIDPSMVDTSRGIKCNNCGCLYFPPRGLGIKGPAPKYCPECGRKMINWKEIKI